MPSSDMTGVNCVASHGAADAPAGASANDADAIATMVAAVVRMYFTGRLLALCVNP